MDVVFVAMADYMTALEAGDPFAPGAFKQADMTLSYVTSGTMSLEIGAHCDSLGGSYDVMFDDGGTAQGEIAYTRMDCPACE